MVQKKTPQKGSPQGSAGYPEIEKLIDSENFDEINKVFSKAYSELEKLSKSKKSVKQPREAKKGMKALQLTLDLFRELLGIKYQLQEELKHGHEERRSK